MYYPSAEVVRTAELAYYLITIPLAVTGIVTILASRQEILERRFRHVQDTGAWFLTHIAEWVNEEQRDGLGELFRVASTAMKLDRRQIAEILGSVIDDDDPDATARLLGFDDRVGFRLWYEDITGKDDKGKIPTLYDRMLYFSVAASKANESGFRDRELASYCAGPYTRVVKVMTPWIAGYWVFGSAGARRANAEDLRVILQTYEDWAGIS